MLQIEKKKKKKQLHCMKKRLLHLQELKFQLCKLKRLTSNIVILVELWLRVRVNDCQNPEFKILDCQNPEFKILNYQNPEFKILGC